MSDMKTEMRIRHKTPSVNGLSPTKGIYPVKATLSPAKITPSVQSPPRTEAASNSVLGLKRTISAVKIQRAIENEMMAIM